MGLKFSQYRTVPVSEFPDVTVPNGTVRVQYLFEQYYSTVLVQRKCCWVRCTYVHSPKLAKILDADFFALPVRSVKQNSVQYEIIQAHLASFLSFHCVPYSSAHTTRSQSRRSGGFSVQYLQL